MRPEFESLADLQQHLQQNQSCRGAVFQDIDLRSVTERLESTDLDEAIFLGCQIAPDLYPKLARCRAIIFPEIPDTPFQKYRGLLYTPEELQGDYRVGDESSYDQTVDGVIYQHFMKLGPNPDDAAESLTRRLHDMAITDAMQEFIRGERVVAIMGGHSMLRDDPMYAEVALLGRELTRHGYLVATGGGPGAMEAGHLGAWFATRDESQLLDAVSILASAPLYKPKGPWLDAAMRVVEKYPVQDRDACQSLGIPTWLYGHEPPARFALTIAKYFANSVREEVLLAIARGGVIFTPGSAGTIQEVFQDACQNHYKTFEVVSPMVFMGEQYWTEKKPVYPLLQQLAQGCEYEKWLAIHDDRNDVVSLIERYHDEQRQA